jgi:hypothetical protein
MAVQHQQPTPARYVDLPALSETFADSIHTVVWDGQALRVEFSVTRFPEATSATPTEAKRYPACRLVLTPQAGVDLFNRLQQTMAALASAGIVTHQGQKSPQP